MKDVAILLLLLNIIIVAVVDIWILKWFSGTGAVVRGD